LNESIALTGAKLGNLPLTNTLLTSILVMLLIVGVCYKATRSMQLVPSGLQNFVEFIIESLYNLIASIETNERKVRLFFPFVATFFIFILTSNYVGLLPGVGTIGYYANHTFVPFLRSAASDLNMTLALAIFSVITAHVLAIREQGIKGYLAIWFSLNPILLFVGLLELVGEVTKVISLSFRLFGNIFAGETVLEVVGHIFGPYLAPLPFLGLELVLGGAQALVFAMLTLASLVILTMDHNSEAH
jgi:F-type H+-transporting ATPase subunit a